MNEKSLAIIPRSLTEATELAERLSKSSLLPKDMIGKMPDILVTILAGQEMGFAPMASLRAFNVIGGKPVLGADGMVALVLGSGLAVYFERVAESDSEVTYETLRVGSKAPPRRCTWTMAMAKTAALHMKDNWRTFPRAMLASRAKSELARDVYPDVLAGCYTEDEVVRDGPATFAMPPHIKPITPQDIVDAEIVSETTEDLAKLCAEAPSLDQLEALKDRCAALPDGPKRTLVRTAYGARLKYFEQQLKATAAVPATATAAEPAA